MDLRQYTLPKLKQLSTRISKEIERKQSASKVSVLKKLIQLAREHGLSLGDVLADSTTRSAPKAASKPAATGKAPLPAKYRHPNNRDLGWSGRGRKPQWVAAWQANGGSMDALEVTAQKFAKKQVRPSASIALEQIESAAESDTRVTAAE